MYQKRVLKNGVRLVSERIDSVRSVSIGLWLDAGSRHETPGESGLSHLVEHCAGDHRPDCPIIDDLAGEVHAPPGGRGKLH